MIERRRALMGQKSNVLLPVFELHGRAVVAGEQISTNFMPLAEDVSFTIMLDFQVTTNVTSGYGRLWKLLYCYNSTLSEWGLVLGKRRTADQRVSVWWNNAAISQPTNLYTDAGRIRVVLTHEANSDLLTVYSKRGTNKMYKNEYTQSFTASNINILYLGGVENSDNALPPGTINEAVVYDKILDNAAINEFFA